MLDCLTLGAGPPVILVHGTGGGREETWAKQLPLSNSYQLVLPDRRGYGTSPPAKVVDQVAEVIAGGIGAELITIPGGHGVQHRAGFNERVLALWSGSNPGN